MMLFPLRRVMPAYKKSHASYQTKIPRRDDRVKWAYLAGIVDGEGTISVRFYPKRNERSIAIQVGNTSSKLLNYLYDTFGGTIDRGYKTKGNKLFRLWKVAGSIICKRFLIGLKPYLVIKEDQAETALEFIKSFRHVTNGRLYRNVGKHNKLWPEREKLRESLYLKNKELNKGEIYAGC